MPHQPQRTARARVAGWSLAALAATALVLLAAGTGRPDAAPPARAPELPITFNRDVRPILSDKCFVCHGPDRGSRKAELRLDSRDDATAPHEHGTPVVPGNAQKSELVRRVFSADPDEVMPPPESKLSLTDGERETLRRWIAEGAAYEKHWAYQPLPEGVTVPEVAGQSWPRDDIDRFILARLESEGLAPSPEVPRDRWLRRVTFDLTGLPPTPEEIDAFLADQAPEAYERIADRLLASPHFGERMAVPWLDAARYADSYGFQSDLISPTWPYRDWVIRALNANMPFDQFLTEQLAGDVLEGATRDDRLATAFNRLHRMTNEGGSIPEEWRIEAAADRVETFSNAVLGVTMQCARCHDHKYDPFTQREYYQLTAYFNSIDEDGLYERSDIVPTPSLLLPSEEQEHRLAELQDAVAQAEADASRVLEAREPAFGEWLAAGTHEATIPDLIGSYALDAIGEGGALHNDAAKGAGDGVIEVAASTGPPVLAPGHGGQAIQLDGDNLAHFPGVGALDRWTPFTISFWMQDTQPGPGARVVAHRSSGTDAGHYGFDLLLEDGHLTARAFRHWPGNAIAVRTAVLAVPPAEWTHVVWRYDGSSRAEGFSIVVNGEPAPSEVVRDHVWKTIGGGSTYGPGGYDLVLGQRFRDRGLKGGRFDDVAIVLRDVTDTEARQLFDGHALNDTLRDAGASDAMNANLRSYYFSAIDPETRAAAGALAEARKALAQYENAIPEIMVMEELPRPRPTYLLARGVYDAPKNDETRVHRDVPAALADPAHTPPADRLALARWLTSPNHPLTARVAVNRLWQVCFGRGLAATSENLGVQGRPPTHPELLDSLARAFIDSGWDTKAMLRRIVLSATYRQDSALTPELLERDPENLLLSRGPSRRLDAEMIRDSVLAAAGLLSPQIGGPPAHPYQPAGLWTEFNGFSPAYPQGHGEDLYRRSLYTVWKRTAPMPSMITFDAPGREVCVARRSETNTPLQALVLLNDVQFVEAARVLAQHALPASDSDEARIADMFRRLAGRSPNDREASLLLDLLAEQRTLYAQQPDEAAKLLGVGESPLDASPDESLDKPELAALTIVAQTIMNSDAAVWQR